VVRPSRLDRRSIGPALRRSTRVSLRRAGHTIAHVGRHREHSRGAAAPPSRRAAASVLRVSQLAQRSKDQPVADRGQHRPRRPGTCPPPEDPRCEGASRSLAMRDTRLVIPGEHPQIGQRAPLPWRGSVRNAPSTRPGCLRWRTGQGRPSLSGMSSGSWRRPWIWTRSTIGAALPTQPVLEAGYDNPAYPGARPLVDHLGGHCELRSIRSRHLGSTPRARNLHHHPRNVRRSDRHLRHPLHRRPSR
jgi:hypothetical protein